MASESYFLLTRAVEVRVQKYFNFNDFERRSLCEYGFHAVAADLVYAFFMYACDYPV